MDSTGPVRNQSDLAEMVELLLEKGVVINADVVVSVGDTELLGVELRAAIASFETAAKYGLEFPEGTDEERVIEAADQSGEGVEGGSTEELPDDSEDASSTKARSLRLRPGGPAASGGSGETVGGASSVADEGTSEADRKTPAGAEDVTIDPAPYDPTREDYDPDADEPGAEHPDVDDPNGEGSEGTDDTGEDESDGADEPEGEGSEGTDDTEEEGSDADDATDASDADASSEPNGDGGGDGE